VEDGGGRAKRVEEDDMLMPRYTSGSGRVKAGVGRREEGTGGGEEVVGREEKL
jgi:hypothetical protein